MGFTYQIGEVERERDGVEKDTGTKRKAFANIRDSYSYVHNECCCTSVNACLSNPKDGIFPHKPC